MPVSRRAFLRVSAATALASGVDRPGLRWEGPPGAGLGPGASLGGRRPFPDDDPWNLDVSGLPVDPRSDVLVAGIGREESLHPDFGPPWRGRPVGIPYVVVPGDQPRVPVRFHYARESDPGPYPIPPDAPVEGGLDARGDRHVLVVDRDRWTLHELWKAYPEGRGWRAGAGASFDLARPSRQRPERWTSADAAGLPIFPGLARFDEAVERGEIHHALRFTCRRVRRAYVAPASHYVNWLADPDLPPLGLRARLRADFDASGFPPTARVILTALKIYGMILADVGSDWFLSGAPDDRWDREDLATLTRVRGRDFQVVRMGRVVTG